jgi:Holliday junction resolvase RusA-like endonuclease
MKITEKIVLQAYPKKDGLVITSNDTFYHKVKAKRVKEIRDISRSVFSKYDKVTEYPVKFIFECFWFDKRRRDVDNIQPTCKAIIDGIVDAGVIIDDNTYYVVETRYVNPGHESYKNMEKHDKNTLVVKVTLKDSEV